VLHRVRPAEPAAFAQAPGPFVEKCLGELMASLKKNIQIIHDSIAKNVSIVSAQAREKARNAAHEYMQNRTNQDVRVLKNKDYEDADAVLAWLSKLEEINQTMPDIEDDEELAAEHAGNGAAV
jgi:hypothetical protein